MTDSTSSRPRSPAIALRRVAKRYGHARALAPTDLEIGEGEFFCLLGPSGSGKTTLLNLIGGFVSPDEGGIIEVRGERVERTPPHQRCVNTVFQRYALFPHMTVEENVAFGLRMAKVPRKERLTRVADVLDLVGLSEQGRRFPNELSGGQQQRVAVARALVNQPAVLLLDEPLGALDLKLRRHLQVELAQIHREVGSTFVYVTHDQEEAMSMADRIAVLNRGSIEQIGSSDEIYSAPRTRFVADFIGESNFFPIVRQSTCGRAGVAELRDGTKVPTTGVIDTCDTLMVRPECVRIDGPGRDRGIAGTIVQATFLGSHSRIVIESAVSEAPICASVQKRDHDAAPHLEPGRSIVVWWRPEDAALLWSDPADADGEGRPR